MLEVGIGGRITITRGDSGSIAVAIVNGATGESYELQKNDTLVFSVKKNAYGNAEMVIEKTLVGTNVFDFEPDDTKHLELGDYVYDIVLKTAAGSAFTVCTESKFSVGVNVHD